MRRKEKGFSMLETIMVSGVVLVACASTAPSLVKASRAQKLNSAAQQISQSLQAAKYDAIRKNVSQAVIFNVANNSLQISDPTPTEPTRVKTILTLPAGVTFSGCQAPPSTVSSSVLQAGTLTGQSGLSGQSSNSQAAVSFPAGKAEFNSRGIPTVQPGAVNWVYLKNTDGEMAVITLTSAGSTGTMKMQNGSTVWKGISGSKDEVENSSQGSCNSGTGS
jgi:type II secretory pathway pseudopilin PulG